MLPKSPVIASASGFVVVVNFVVGSSFVLACPLLDVVSSETALAESLADVVVVSMSDSVALSSPEPSAELSFCNSGDVLSTGA